MMVSTVTWLFHHVGECVCEWVNVRQYIAKRFEWPLVRAALCKCSPLISLFLPIDPVTANHLLGRFPPLFRCARAPGGGPECLLTLRVHGCSQGGVSLCTSSVRVRVGWLGNTRPDVGHRPGIVTLSTLALSSHHAYTRSDVAL